MSDYDSILIEREGRVARVSFNRPDKLNSFNGTMRREFVRAAQEVNADNDIWVVVLTGEGRAFGAGADLSDTSEPMPNGGEGVEEPEGVLQIALAHTLRGGRKAEIDGDQRTAVLCVRPLELIVVKALEQSNGLQVVAAQHRCQD